MYSFVTILALAVPLMVAANPLVSRTDSGTTCNNGSPQCCNQLQEPSNNNASTVLSLLGIEAIVGALVGLNCDPITLIGTGSTGCQNTVVCCTNNQFNGLVNIGCTPININL